MPDVVITLTVRQHEHKVTTDRGFFSSPEHNGSYLNHPLAKTSKEIAMNTITRWDQSRGLTLRDQVNRLFEDNLTRDRSGHADLATWAPPVDIYETEHELVVKADLPDLQDKDIDVRVENNTLTIRGERKFEKDVKEDNYLRIERAYGSFMRSFSLPNTVSSENIRAEYRNGVLTLHLAKREESKPKQIKISVSAHGK
jgi:HSP20 family protein